jgi:ABC-type Mn2+/Zn2+ transport system ATPase subunit
MTSHDVTMLSRYADTVVLFDHKLICKGTPEEVLESDDFRRVFRMKGGADK